MAAWLGKVVEVLVSGMRLEALKLSFEVAGTMGEEPPCER